MKSHPRSSIFHTAGWLEALHRTYGYEPIVFTTSPPRAELQNGLVFCQVKSWLTGCRLVSLPFSDHCDPLVDDEYEMNTLLSVAEERLRQKRFRYIEIRPVHPLLAVGDRFQSSNQHCLHRIDLTRDLDTLFRNCHKSSTQRKIVRAQKEKLAYEEGRSKAHLDIFYRLLLLTRQRHKLPPQPRKWFQSLIDCLGESLKISIALKGKQPVASIITLQHKDTILYKYGCSDARFNNLGGMHLLLWRSIEEAKSQRLRVMDLGRSDSEAAGLVIFKDRWGSSRSMLPYFRFSVTDKGQFVSKGWKERAAKHLLSHVPDRILTFVGDAIYRHIG